MLMLLRIRVAARMLVQPGKNFYLNRLAFEDQSSSSHHSVISLPELLDPVQSISQIFIATFTIDISCFLSSCEIPSHLPVTVACHNTERCWSSSTENRTSAPYPEYPNLIIVYPPFPETIAFGEDLKRHGIGCHHPKLFVLQRDDNIRVIITSANLVPTQWSAVTNTSWWQDFPCRSVPDYSSLFTQFPGREVNEDPKSDFASYLAGFIATLLTDVPSQARWIVELAKYDFGGAVGHLVASVPGIHSYKTPYIVESRHCVLDCVQLGFLPRNIANWVSPLWDIGFFRFLGYVCPRSPWSSFRRKQQESTVDASCVTDLEWAYIEMQSWIFAGTTVSGYIKDDATSTCNCIMLIGCGY